MIQFYTNSSTKIKIKCDDNNKNYIDFYTMVVVIACLKSYL